MLKADRYTRLSIHRDSVPDRLAEAVNLRLKYAVLPDWSDDKRVYLYLFFDDQALTNYLAGNYGSFANDVRRLMVECPTNEALGATVRALMVEIDGE